VKRLYFVRHGLSQGNIDGVWTGRIDTPLTTDGRKQAKSAARSIKKLNIDYIVSSPLSRARETAEIVAKGIGYPIQDIHINKMFIERHFGELEGRAWNPDLDLDGIVDIETKDTLLERAHLALEFIKTLEAENILIVSHGSFGRAMRHLATGQIYHHNHVPEDAKIPNAKVVCWI
jgi:uncharacterized phosphatase